MIKKITSSIAISVFYFVCSSAAFAQLDAAALAYFKRNTEYVLSNAARLIRPALNAHERSIQSSIEVYVPAEHAMIAQAYPGRIVISAGTTWIFEQLAISNVAEYELGFSGCDQEYVEYMGMGIVRNTERYYAGLRPIPVLSPELYGHRYGGGCDGFRTSTITESGNGEFFAVMIESSLMYLYLHELAHHVLEHVDKVPPDLSYSREAEAAADAWAVATAFRVNYNIMNGAPMMNLLGVLGGNSIEAERKMLHPLGVRRVRDMLLQTIEQLEKIGEWEAADWLEDNLRRAEATMPGR